MMTHLIQDMDRTIAVMHSVGQWMLDSGKNPSKWWLPENLNEEFLTQYAQPEEFYVVEIDGKDAGAAIFQMSQNSQDWKTLDKGHPPQALYIHWLCVAREFAGKGVPKMIISYARELAKKNNIHLLRVDTNASETILRNMYEDLEFSLVGVEKEDYRTTAFYQRAV